MDALVLTDDLNGKCFREKFSFTMKGTSHLRIYVSLSLPLSLSLSLTHTLTHTHLLSQQQEADIQCLVYTSLSLKHARALAQHLFLSLSHCNSKQTLVCSYTHLGR